MVHRSREIHEGSRPRHEVQHRSNQRANDLDEGQGRRPRVLFLGLGYAGHRVRFENLRAHTQDDPRIDATYRLVSGWKDGGLIERLPIGSAHARGSLRAMAEASAFLQVPRPDVIWTSALSAIRPWVLGYVGPMRRPLILDRDCAVGIRDDWSQVYWHRAPTQGIRRRVRKSLTEQLARIATLWTPWSEWTANSLRESGVPPERICVNPPGVDLTQWCPSPRSSSTGERVRLLFVGADFERKGGNLLLEVLSSSGQDRFELDIVTREDVQESANVRVHRAGPNSAALRELYAAADVFVMPSYAECFGIATLEAMASGLPVIVGNTGASPEIVGDEAGWAIPPRGEDLAAALDTAWDNRRSLRAIGMRARARTEACYDADRNDRRVVDLALDLARSR